MKKVLLVVVATLCGVGVVSASASAATGYGRVGAFAEAFADGQASHQQRIAVNHASGDVYVTDVVGDRIAVYRPNGTGADLLTTFAVGDVTDPLGIAIDQATGAVYVSDDNDVVRYVSDGAPTPTFTKDNTFTSPGVTGPLAFDQADDELLVADTATNTVRRYSNTGAAGATFDGTAGSGSPGAFTGLQDLAVDSTGDVVVVDATGDPADNAGSVSRVERFSAAGSFEATIAADPDAAIVAVRPGDDAVIVSGNQNAVYANEKPTVQVFAPDGSSLGSALIDDSAIYSTITGIASDDGPAGQLFVATDVGHYFGSFIYGYTSVQVYDRVQLATVSIGAASSITAGSAQLNGTINPEGAATTYRFEVSADGGTSWSAFDPDGDGDESAGAGTSDVAVSEVYDGLNPASSYRFRIVATRASFAVTSADTAFTTDAAAPVVVQTDAARSTGTSTALLGGRIQTYGLATSYHVEYGTGALTERAPVGAEEVLPAGSGEQVVQVAVSGLSAGTVYRFRFVAENAKGPVAGTVRTFQTRVDAPGSGACPNAAVRAQQAVDLPDCRAYEQVTPLRKPQSEPNGADCCARQVADSGDGIVFNSTRPLTGGDSSPFNVTNLARRGGEGWTTENITPPMDPDRYQLTRSPVFAAFSPDLTLGIVYALRPTLTPDAPVDLSSLYVRDLSRPAAYRLVTTAAEPGYAPFAYETAFADADAGFHHVLFEAPAALTPDAPGGGVLNLYEWSDGQLRLASVLADGSPSLGGAYSGAVAAGSTPNKRNTISRDGRRVFFTDQASGQLFERIDGQSTVQVSASRRETPDPNGPRPAVFRAATPDGKYVFFTSAEKLTGDATTGAASDGSDLYRFDTESGELVDLTVNASGAAQGGARVAGVIGANSAGTMVYFVAGSPDLDGDDQGVEGQPNLYVWSDGDVHLIGTLKPADSGVSGGSFDSLYWDPAAIPPNAAVSDSGDRLVITSYAPLTGLPTDGTSQVYVYRADSESLECASCAPAGQAIAGDANVQPILPVATGGVTQTLARAVTQDGDHVFFTTPQSLVARDVNGKRDVYEYVVSTGQIRLLSSGTGTYDTSYLGSGSDGSDVLVFTRNRLLATDQDSLADIYDIRRGGGFRQVPPPAACQGDQCQGPNAPPPAAPTAGSLTFAGPGDAPSARPNPSTVTVSQAKTVTGTAAKLKVRVPGAGTISTAGSSLRAVGRLASKAATYTLTVSLTAKAKKTLAKKRTLKAAVKVTFKPKAGGSVSKTLTLTFKAPKQRSVTRVAVSKGGRS